MTKCNYTCGAIRPVRERSATNVPTSRGLKYLADWMAEAAPDDSDREWSAEIEAMLRDGEIQRIPPDLQAAANDIAQAQLRVRSARRCLRDDPGGAINAAWEAIRLALTAHMLANGLGAKTRRGGFHTATAAYGIAALGPLDPEGDLGRLDEAREQRSAVSYRHATPDRDTAQANLVLAKRVVELVRGELGA